MDETQQVRRHGLRQRLMRGFGATALNPIATAIIQLGSVPILLHAWGATKYGDWLLLSAIPSYLTLSDLGLGAASGSDMSMRVAAVSYTHLDVYKRQPRDRLPGGCESGWHPR